MPAVPGKAGSVWYAKSLAVLEATGTNNRGSDGQTLSVGDFGEVLKGVGYYDIPAMYTCATVGSSSSTWTAVNIAFPGTVTGGGGASNISYAVHHTSAANSGVSNHWYAWTVRIRRPGRPTWAADQYNIIMPHDGEIVKTIVLSVNITHNNLWFYKNFENPAPDPDNDPPAIAATDLPMDGALAMDGDGNTAYYLDHTWSGATFSKYDRFTFRHSATGAAGAILFTHVFKYDTST